jgi:hypothetical protein
MKESLICWFIPNKVGVGRSSTDESWIGTKKWTDQTRILYHVNCYRNAWLLKARRAVGRFQTKGFSDCLKESEGYISFPVGNPHSGSFSERR